MKIYVDGTLYDKDDAKISVFDHGFLYGDGVFEGIRAYEGNVFRLKEHIERLFRSAKTIALDMPMTQAEMTQAVLDTLPDVARRIPRLFAGVGDSLILETKLPPFPHVIRTPNRFGSSGV